MESLHKSVHGIKWSIFHGHFDYFQKPLLGGRPRPSYFECSQPLVYSTLSCVRTRKNKISLKYNWLRIRSHMTSLRIRDQSTSFGKCGGMAFEHFLLGSHNFLVTALGSCMKWPLVKVVDAGTCDPHGKAREDKTECAVSSLVFADSRICARGPR